jgi:hypothetical protein
MKAEAEGEEKIVSLGSVIHQASMQELWVRGSRYAADCRVDNTYHSLHTLN